ncbi:type II toxin-antitoxin system VapC family toxin [Amycolatopsis suaedae]|uniref:type II toxin-antitoxin system VapC family toxin n=1 Tax=Amycolatopsis suaedae TaxID=2510978 RepID=UPI001F0F3110|nr:type II toxin-antitoxin system VapC family toxin [Amycolatopsis suaedae]
MTVLYADTSAVVRAFMPDEPEHDELAKLLLDNEDLVITSELTRVEFASAMARARNSGRFLYAKEAIRLFDQEVTSSGSLSVVPLEPRVVMPAAWRLVSDNYTLRALDAIHLAVAMHDTSRLARGRRVAMVTRDHRQAEAAKANGMEVL